MTQFKDIIFEKNVAIHCPEEWMANDLLKYADSKGYKWKSGEGYLEYNNWRHRKHNTCYWIKDGNFGSIFNLIKSDELLHYNDVVIKDETSLDYELIIKGRKAEIGSVLWKRFQLGKMSSYSKHKVVKIKFIDNNKLVYFLKEGSPEGNEYAINLDYDKEYMDSIFFWEKPIIYQLPDTEGNLSEVKVGQEVWVESKHLGNCWCKIEVCKNGIIKAKAPLGYWEIANISGLITNTSKATTNKSHRDFSDCMDWSHAPKEAICWAIDKNGSSKWHYENPKIYGDEWAYSYLEHAGYRADLLNENGVVEDWEHSLIKRPEVK